MKTIEIEITLEDVDNAIEEGGMCYSCPTHQALRRYLKPGLEFCVGFSSVIVVDGPGYFAQLSDELQQQVSNFTRTDNFIPGKYEINIIDESLLK